MSEIIAERVLTDEADPTSRFSVRLERPRLGPEGVDFVCVYSIQGPEIDLERWVAGIDAFQALELAFVAIGAHLTRIENTSGRRLTWMGEDFGFPKP